jgi:hypothetical protein
MPDGDKAGERHAEVLLTLVSPHQLKRCLKLAEGEQSTNLRLGEWIRDAPSKLLGFVKITV